MAFANRAWIKTELQAKYWQATGLYLRSGMCRPNLPTSQHLSPIPSQVLQGLTRLHNRIHQPALNLLRSARQTAQTAIPLLR